MGKDDDVCGEYLRILCRTLVTEKSEKDVGQFILSFKTNCYL